MGAGETSTDGVAAGNGREEDATGVEGAPGGARVADFITSALVAARVVGGGGGAAVGTGVVDLLPPFLTFGVVEGPADG